VTRFGGLEIQIISRLGTGTQSVHRATIRAVIAPGAQTERLGDAGPVSGSVLRGLTGRFFVSPISLRKAFVATARSVDSGHILLSL